MWPGEPAAAVASAVQHSGACMTSVWGLAAIDKRSADASWPTGATSLMLGYCALALSI